MGKRRKKTYRNGDFTLGHSAKWWVADYTVEGKRKRSRLVEASRPESEARGALDKFAETERALQIHKSKFTVGEIWSMWMDERERDGFDNTVYMAQWSAMRPFFANKYPDFITQEDCRTYARTRFAEGRASSTVNTELVRLRTCLAWAYAARLTGPPVKIWVPQSGRPRERVLTPDEANRLLENAKDPHVYLFIVLLFATGGRHKAILDLTWDRISFVTKTIQLDEDAVRDPMSKSWSKGRAYIAMTPRVEAILYKAAKASKIDCPYVIERAGKRLKSCREGFRAAAERAGITGVTPHTVRHTVASWLKGKVDMSLTAQLLGHRDEATTRKVYTHSTPQQTLEAVNIIDAALQGDK